jgi:glycine betaine/proline transport system substrate-binding protein
VTARGPSIHRAGPALIAVVVALALSACVSSSSEDGAVDGVAASSTVPARAERRPTIRIGVTDWTGALVNAAIAERIIERRLGYPVDAVPVADVSAILDDLGAGRLDAILELWPSSLEERERETIASGVLADLGPLGVEGKIGWYVPRYVAEGELGVDSWEVLLDPTVTAAFAVASTGDRGRFLGTDPGYEQYDEELIDELGLPLTVEYSGSDAATAAEVDAAVAAERPILLYWWTPTALVARNDLVNVALPPRTDECVADLEGGGPARCDYPVEVLFKLGSPELASRAPEVDRFLRALRLTTDDQLGLIDQVENRGLTVDEAVDAWVAANQARWEAWLG